MGRRIPLDPQVRHHSEIHLVRLLLRNRFAVARMEKIAKQFPEMVDMPLMQYPPFYECPGTATKPPVYSIEQDIPAKIDRARVEEYALELWKLADHYGLRCDWIIGKLHTQVRHLIDPSFRMLYIVGGVTSVIDDFNVRIRITPETRKEDVLREVKKEWQRVTTNPKFRQRIKPPLNLNDAVEFLGLHFISKWSFERIAKHINEETKGKDGEYFPADIETAIRKAARLLDVELTSKRPRKAKKI